MAKMGNSRGWRGGARRGSGMFIHWGPSSLSGKEISSLRISKDFCTISTALNRCLPRTWDNLYKRFNPVEVRRRRLDAAGQRRPA